MAQLLHVSPRTLHNWNAGKYDIPYAAYKLLRVLLHYELPDPAWKGWHFAQGRLWTPEGHSIAAHESSWWSLMVRMARQYLAASTRCRDLERQLGAQGSPETRPVTRSGGGSGAGEPGALAPAQGPARSAGP
ncbi:MAG: phage protein [Burkholderiales bacterium]|nr:phage protein [Burkholderiales bacterium]